MEALMYNFRSKPETSLIATHRKRASNDWENIRRKRGSSGQCGEERNYGFW